jgi:tetratricopeptide (TPR) repeat protein
MRRSSAPPPSPEAVTPARLDRTVRDAARRRHGGDLAGAEAGYRRVLAAAPDHPGALHGLGVLALQVGRADLAIGLIGRAARLAPGDGGMHRDLGLALRARDHLEDARAALHVATLLDPDDAAAWAAMADTLGRLNRLTEAAAAYRVAIALAPDHAGFHHALGLLLRAGGAPAEAAEALGRATALAPDDPDARADLAGLLVELGRPDAAEREARAALARRPDDARARNNLGLALQDLERPEEALAAFEAARRLAPDDPDIANNLGVALRDLDRADAALACFDEILAAHPEHAPAHLNAASVLLMRGEFARGWREFEWRDRVPGALRRDPPAPRWRGEPLDGRVLLLQAEMGLGDTIQFCRFARRVEGRVVLRVPAPLVRLLGGLGVAVVPMDQPPPAFDAWCGLASLPGLLGGDLAPEPYLRADPASVAAWRARLAGLAGRRIGLCWAGSRGYARDRARSLPEAALRALAATLSESEGGPPTTPPLPPGEGRGEGRASLISLQKDARPPPDLPIHDWTDDLGDMADTAALIEALDLVISVDTAVAHLAGALGKPVLLLDRFTGDWRWMRGRDDSPWYPSLRILRQPRPGDWPGAWAGAWAALR